MEPSFTIILASSSPRRRALLQDLKVPFETRPSSADETLDRSLSPERNVQLLAERKVAVVARETAEQFGQAIVIGADTVVSIAGEILGKPATAEGAAAMLSRLQGQTHTVFSGLCVARTDTGQRLSGYSATQVTMRPLSAEAIRQYVATGEPMDKAGAYGIQGYGSTLVTRISGDYFTVMGMPMFLLEDFLQQCGISLLQFGSAERGLGQQ